MWHVEHTCLSPKAHDRSAKKKKKPTRTKSGKGDISEQEIPLESGKWMGG